MLVVAGAVLIAWPFVVRREHPLRRPLTWAVASVLATALPLLVGALFVEEGGSKVDLRATGSVQVEQGPLSSGQFAAGEGTFSLEGEDMGARVTPLPPHDQLSIRASVSGPDGAFDIEVDNPLVSDPLGRHTTWWGIGLNVWHHGRSGIGTDLFPEIRSEVAVFGLASVSAAGRELASFVPVHAMTTDDGLDLVVGDPDLPIAALPNGHLHVVWPTYEGGADDSHPARYAIGGVVLLALLAFALGAVTRPNGFEFDLDAE